MSLDGPPAAFSVTRSSSEQTLAGAVGIPGSGITCRWACSGNNISCLGACILERGHVSPHMCTECCNQAETVSQGVGLCAAFGFVASRQGAALQAHALEHLRIVDPYADEGVRVTLDQGCNS